MVSCGTILLAYGDLAVSRLSGESLVKADELRVGFNQMGLEIIKKYPVLGVGVGNYLPALKDMYKLQPWEHQPAHNIYIFLAAELGILGLALFFIIIFQILRSTWNQIGEPIIFSLFLAICVFLFMGLFDHYFLTIQQGRLVFFIALGLLAASQNSEN